MKRLNCIVAFLMFLSAAIYLFHDGSAKEMLAEKPHMVAHCVGRTISEFPAEFRSASITTGNFKPAEWALLGPSVDVIVRDEEFTGKKFLKEMAGRRVELKENSDENVDVFRLKKKLADDAILFRVQKIDDAYISEVNFLLETSLVTVKLESFRNQYLAAEESLVKFALAFKKKGEGNIAGARQEFCLGPVAIAGDFQGESGNFQFMKGDGSDFEIDINTYQPDASKPLLERISGPDSLLALFNVEHKVLRAGERTVASMHAQEWLGWAKLSDETDARSLKFTLDTMRLKPGKAAPGITVTFNTGKPIPGGGVARTVVSDQEALQLWDSVIGSIRSVMP